MVLRRQKSLSETIQTDKEKADAVAAAYQIGLYDLAERKGLTLFLIFAASFLFGLVVGLVGVGFFK